MTTGPVLARTPQGGAAVPTTLAEFYRRWRDKITDDPATRCWVWRGKMARTPRTRTI